jgi:N-acetylglucosamine-6-phosphate deacetylase
MTTTFTNCRLCINGTLRPRCNVTFNDKIVRVSEYDFPENANDTSVIDLKGVIVAPGLIELQTNGVKGFHFTHFQSKEEYEVKLEETARYYATEGVTSFWATIPTVDAATFKRVKYSLL